MKFSFLSKFLSQRIANWTVKHLMVHFQSKFGHVGYPKIKFGRVGIAIKSALLGLSLAIFIKSDMLYKRFARLVNLITAVFQLVLNLSETQVPFLYSKCQCIFPITFLKVNYSHCNNILVENFARSIYLTNFPTLDFSKATGICQGQTRRNWCIANEMGCK